MAQVTRSVALDATAEDVWALIGGFQALPDWHPAVEASGREEAGGAERRRLALADGGEILEESRGADAASYGYTIVEGPLPVRDYIAVLSVAPAGAGCVVVWCSTFSPTAPDAETTIAGIYQAGLGALAARFG